MNCRKYDGLDRNRESQRNPGVKRIKKITPEINLLYDRGNCNTIDQKKKKISTVWAYAACSIIPVTFGVTSKALMVSKTMRLMIMLVRNR